MFKKLFRFLKWLIITLIILAAFFYSRFDAASEPVWGVNFSIEQAAFLGLDWKQVYTEMFADLKPKRLRLMAYWELLEPRQGQFDFADIDYQLTEAKVHDAQVILVLGHKQPRYPECHHPQWYEELTAQEREAAVLAMLEQAVEHFKSFNSIYAWQLENEPFFPYGPDCPGVPRALFAKELEVVRAADPRPIVVTDSGEKGAWLPTAWAAAGGGGEIFGSTMYRKVYHDKKLKYIEYFIPSAIYRVKAGMVGTLSSIKRVIGVELQAEPWFRTDAHNTAWDEQEALMNPQIFSDYVAYARSVGFAENYFWGVEWWYWAREQGHPEMWEAAKDLFRN